MFIIPTPERRNDAIGRKKQPYRINFEGLDILGT
jgi:hypothetical protein